MAEVKRQQVVEFVYQLTLSQYEMEVLYVILGDASDWVVQEKMKDYDIDPKEENDETAYELYEIVREVLGRDVFGNKQRVNETK